MIRLLLLFFICIPFFSMAATPDVRVLIDVSGSMKKNDPKMLRRPAVRLLAGILPRDATLGLGIFGEKVSWIRKPIRIGDKLPEQLRQLERRIHSNDKTTDIEGALSLALQSFSDSADKHPRVLILLTDGMVDTPGDAAEDAASRKRILEKWLSAAKTSNVRIYTIALSREADSELLERLSITTNAWFEQVDSADALHKAFMRIFEQFSQQPSVPIRENIFKVDKSVEEFTLLAFKKSGYSLALRTPDGKQFEMETAPDGVSWYGDRTFDLVTVKAPIPGEWKIIGPLEPDNRVFVVSDLVLEINDGNLPTSLLAGDNLTLTASLKEKDRIIKLANFLKLVRLEGTVQINDEAPTDIIFGDDGRDGDAVAADGIFSYPVTIPRDDADIHIAVAALSPTFEREFRRTIRVYAHFFNLEFIAADEDKSAPKIVVIAREGVTKDDSLSLSAVIRGSDGTENPLTLVYNEEKKHWSADLSTYIPGDYEVIVQGSGETHFGRTFSDVVEKIRLTLKKPSGGVKKAQQDLAQTTASETQAEPVEAKTADEAEMDEERGSGEKEAQPETVDEAPEESSGYLWWVIGGIVFNLIVGGLGWWFWQRWRKQRESQLSEIQKTVSGNDTDEVQET